MMGIFNSYVTVYQRLEFFEVFWWAWSRHLPRGSLTLFPFTVPDLELLGNIVWIQLHPRFRIEVTKFSFKILKYWSTYMILYVYWYSYIRDSELKWPIFVLKYWWNIYIYIDTATSEIQNWSDQFFFQNTEIIYIYTHIDTATSEIQNWSDQVFF